MTASAARLDDARRAPSPAKRPLQLALAATLVAAWNGLLLYLVLTR